MTKRYVKGWQNFTFDVQFFCFPQIFKKNSPGGGVIHKNIQHTLDLFGSYFVIWNASLQSRKDSLRDPSLFFFKMEVWFKLCYWIEMPYEYIIISIYSGPFPKNAMIFSNSHFKMNLLTAVRSPQVMLPPPSSKVFMRGKDF